ncbi:glycosyltransferase family 2 protein [Longispora albida]|uniref:glycosyltransferase family 2 protein n=1 Tax=Longispora albida TaxID=203523 RepID=UPI000364CD23|nr:glycosyltransferase family A protein [Longispora albida]
MTLTVSVVIPTYGRRDHLPPMISAIAADPAATEIIVVVDGSRDGSYELLTELAAAEPRLVPLWQDNAGQSAARQAGLERATGDVVLFLDDDVLAGAHLAHGHALAHARRPGLVMLGYMPTDRPQARRAGDFSTHLYAEEYERACLDYERDPSSVLTGLWGGNLSLRRADALRVGVRTARRLGYHEDTDFGLRCAAAGLTGQFSRDLAARHTHQRDLAPFLRQAWLAGEARRILASGYPGTPAGADPATGLGGPVRLAVLAGAHPLAYRVTRAATRAGVRLAGRLGVWPAESGLARLQRQIELVRGYRGLPH